MATKVHHKGYSKDHTSNLSKTNHDHKHINTYKIIIFKRELHVMFLDT